MRESINLLESRNLVIWAKGKTCTFQVSASFFNTSYRRSITWWFFSDFQTHQWIYGLAYLSAWFL